MIPRRIGHWIHELRYEVKPLDERMRFNLNGDEVQQFYLIKDVFTIPDGEWSISQKLGGAEEWAREQYLQDWQGAFQDDSLEYYPHIYTRVETPQGLPIRNKPVIAWSDAYERIFERDFDQYLTVEIDHASGWGRLELNNSSLYDPVLEQGPWSIKPTGFAESVEGIGLPRLMGISPFVVWIELPMTAFNRAAPLPAPAPATAQGLEFQKRLAELARINQLIYFNPEATIQRKIIEDGFVPNSGEFEMEFNNARFVGQQAQHLQTGALRVYFVKRNQWHRVQWMPVDMP